MPCPRTEGRRRSPARNRASAQRSSLERSPNMALRRSSLVLLALVDLLVLAGKPARAAPERQFPRPIPLDPVRDQATMYRGNAALTGEFPGPSPVGPPVFLWRVRLG